MIPGIKGSPKDPLDHGQLAGRVCPGDVLRGDSGIVNDHSGGFGPGLGRPCGDVVHRCSRDTGQSCNIVQKRYQTAAHRTTPSCSWVDSRGWLPR
jgi:hypothetical protein